MVELAESDVIDVSESNWLTDPYWMVAALSLASEEEKAHVRELDRKYAGKPETYIAAASEYLTARLGQQRIEWRYYLMRMGEVTFPSPYD